MSLKKTATRPSARSGGCEGCGWQASYKVCRKKDLKLSIPLGADKNVCPLFVKHHPDALDMLLQFCMGDLVKNREVDLVGQQQVVKFLGDGAKFRRGQGIAVQGQVNVRAVL